MVLQRRKDLKEHRDNFRRGCEKHEGSIEEVKRAINDGEPDKLNAATENSPRPATNWLKQCTKRPLLPAMAQPGSIR